MIQPPGSVLEVVRKLSEESGMGLAFCYKALKKFGYDYQRALAYLKSDPFKRSIYPK